MSAPIVAQTTDNTNFVPPDTPQSFTIRCAECASELGEHLPHCPGVIAAGYDSGNGAFCALVYPTPGASYSKHNSALTALRFYAMVGPVELHMADGRVIAFDEVD